jgi:hypothetical protein
MSDEFSVCQFFRNGYEYVCRFVSAEEAVRTFKQYTHNVSAQTGLTRRVIITDGGDCINLEWQFKKGIVFPTQEQLNDQG